ncbi:histidine phosphatase family protein [Candidatus Saccharibacteria bacterium]|nr:histidine phosphatase family protein [Candidatus Saccharibacteria bacterium]
MAAEIFIARHGQNQDNANHILNGRRDLPLTETGRKQAKDLAMGIKEVGLEFEAIYSSPLQRAHETAKIICRTLGIRIDPIVLPSLIERDFGVMTGVDQSKVEEMCAPNIIKTDTVTYFLNPEGAETFPELVKRGHNALEEVRSRHDTENVLLVCHGDIGKMIYASATNKPWDDVLRDFHFGNGDLIEVSPNDDAHKIKLPQHNL